LCCDFRKVRTKVWRGKKEDREKEEIQEEDQTEEGEKYEDNEISYQERKMKSLKNSLEQRATRSSPK